MVSDPEQFKTWVESKINEPSKSIMMMHTTNYYNVFIEIADDCKTDKENATYQR